ncbi:LacI family transcriptional regulator [Streptomyces spinosirectus]|jgi:LacI family transcriptional regulator|uniref:LacI family DNA-binding transcriptional regulator n=1 Tax=Streptomyces TaxID=1883 RepID=UPI000FFF4558|nr:MULTISPECIES: LacI family DNA-binding transcriptional regulator [Streptomyces]MBY8345932.1 LacI family DNA-binding transcriptional regulator [Streptomyces plumbidurans]UIR20794.1 LacI family transcriptional regulator [Streptomyces spinosirectus]
MAMAKPSRARRITIADVARAADASVSTVSRVLNGIGTVDPALAERVRLAIEELGYRPSAAAQGLARGRSGTIGVLVPDLANPHFSDLVKVFSATVRDLGARVLVMDSDEDPAVERELAEDLVRYADGLLLCAPRMPRADLAALVARGLPLLVANRQEPGLALHSVCIDVHAGLLAVCGHLAQLGHRKVAYLAGPEGSWANRERLRALSGAQAFGLEVTVLACGSLTDDGYAAGPAVLGTDATAVIAYNDFVALGLLSRLAEAGVSVPGDLSLTGFDEIDLARYSSPPLTTVAVPRSELGRAAGEALARLMAGEDDMESRTLPVELRVRESTGTA